MLTEANPVQVNDKLSAEGKQEARTFQYNFELEDVAEQCLAEEVVEDLSGKDEWGGQRSFIIRFCYLAIRVQYAYNNLGIASDLIHFVYFILFCLPDEVMATWRIVTEIA